MSWQDGGRPDLISKPRLSIHDWMIFWVQLSDHVAAGNVIPMHIYSHEPKHGKSEEKDSDFNIPLMMQNFLLWMCLISTTWLLINWSVLDSLPRDKLWMTMTIQYLIMWSKLSGGGDRGGGGGVLQLNSQLDHKGSHFNFICSVKIRGVFASLC